MAQRCRESTFGYKEIETFPSGFTSTGLVPPCPLFLSIPAHPLLVSKTAQDFLPGAVHTFYNLTAAHMCTPSPVPLHLITRAALAWTNRRLPLPVSSPNTATSPLSATCNLSKDQLQALLLQRVSEPCREPQQAALPPQDLLR